jgi:integration host factor subunit alpha
MAVTKAEISQHLADQTEIQIQDAKSMVDEFFEDLRELLEADTLVKFSGFGNFVLRHKSARPGRNPKTGREVKISERRVVTFKTGQKLRLSVNKKCHQSQAL